MPTQKENAINCVENLSASQKKEVKTAKGLAKCLSVDVVIKIFGIVIFQYHFPPQK